MKKLARIFGYILIVLTLAVLLLFLFDYEYILRGARITYLSGHTSAYIDDYPEFENRIIPAGNNFQPWPESKAYNSVTPTQELKELNKELGTAAFLIIRQDSLWFEQYYDEYGAESKTNSFSMAKSIVSAMLGKAIQEGYIENLDQPVADFIPRFDPALTVGDLSSMASGLNWNENYYNPFSETAEAYFSNNIRELALDMKVVEKPGEKFEYLSGNVQLLALVLEKATGHNLSEYLSEKFWKPMGMKTNALWQLDSRESGMEKAYCCIASNARDFARFGKLYEHYGNWNGNQILDSAFVAKSIQPRFNESPEYGYGFWLSDYRNKDIFYMRGLFGQYVIVIPEDELIIVRLGQDFYGKPKEVSHHPDFFIYIDQTYKMLKNASETQS